jgi:hypothetical protein
MPPIEAPPLQTFLTLTSPSKKKSEPPSRAGSFTTGVGAEKPAARGMVGKKEERTGSSSEGERSDEEFGQNGFLVLTSLAKGQTREALLNKIEEEAVEDS